jgi:hydrogenase maturation protease
VLALGNPLSGDDGFGACVLEQLQHGELPSGVQLEDASTDLLCRIPDFAEYDQIVLIDAVLDPEGKLGKPGHIAAYEEAVFRVWPETSPSVHQVSPLLAVKLFRTLYPESRSQITLVGLIVDHVGQKPVYATEARIAEAAATVLALTGHPGFREDQPPDTSIS